MKGISTFLAVFMLLALSPVKVPAAAAGDGRAGGEGGVTVGLQGPARAGETTVLFIRPDRELPAGGFWRVDVTWIERPEGRSPEVLAGVPQTDIRFLVPGRYRCLVETGVVTRGSCAGASYARIASHALDIDVAE